MLPVRGLWRAAYGPLSLVAIVALTVALHGHRSVVRSYRARDEAIRHQLIRLAVKDRLIGSRVPDVALLDHAGAALRLRKPGRGRVVWVVDVGNCPGCLESSLADWHRLLERIELEGLLVLSGVGSASGTRVIRGAGVRSPVAFDPEHRVSRVVGVTAPFLVFVNDERGLVVSADASVYGLGDRRCGRGPFHRIEAIYGRRVPVSVSL
jgi:hypothetical protein